MPRFKLYFSDGYDRDDIQDLLDEYDAEVVECNFDHVVLDVEAEYAEAFSEDAENTTSVDSLDEVR